MDERSLLAPDVRSLRFPAPIPEEAKQLVDALKIVLDRFHLPRPAIPVSDQQRKTQLEIHRRLHWLLETTYPRLDERRHGDEPSVGIIAVNWLLWSDLSNNDDPEDGAVEEEEELHQQPERLKLWDVNLPNYRKRLAQKFGEILLLQLTDLSRPNLPPEHIVWNRKKRSSLIVAIEELELGTRPFSTDNYQAVTEAGPGILAALFLFEGLQREQPIEETLFNPPNAAPAAGSLGSYYICGHYAGNLQNAGSLNSFWSLTREFIRLRAPRRDRFVWLRGGYLTLYPVRSYLESCLNALFAHLLATLQPVADHHSYSVMHEVKLGACCLNSTDGMPLQGAYFEEVILPDQLLGIKEFADVLVENTHAYERTLRMPIPDNRLTFLNRCRKLNALLDHNQTEKREITLGGYIVNSALWDLFSDYVA